MALTLYSSAFGSVTPYFVGNIPAFNDLLLQGEPYTFGENWNTSTTASSYFVPIYYVQDLLQHVPHNGLFVFCFPFKENSERAIACKLSHDTGSENASYRVGVINKQGEFIASQSYELQFGVYSYNWFLSVGQVKTNYGNMLIPFITGRADNVLPPAPEGYFNIANLDFVSNYYDTIGKYLMLENINTFDDMYGEEAESGGYTGGSFDHTSDIIGIPSVPTIGVSSVGFVNVYKCDINSLTDLGIELFPQFEPIEGEGIVDALTGVCTNIAQAVKIMLNSQLINYVVDCHIIPVTPLTGNTQPIKIGYKTMTQSAQRVNGDYVDFDCGILRVRELYGNFADYSGTTAKLYLPFVGFVGCEPEWFQSGALQVKYRFNVIDGSFIAYVLSTSSKSQLKETVIAQYGGNACVHIPITGANYANLVSGVIGGATSTLSATSAPAMVSSALGTMSSRGSVESSNSYNATTSFLGVRKPYLLIERVVAQYPPNYQKERGIPSNINKKLGDLTGFTIASSIHLDGINATEEEKNEIASLLSKGVIL